MWIVVRIPAGDITNLHYNFVVAKPLVSITGGDGINMDWLDGMTGCSGPCNLPSSSVTFTDFEIWKDAPPSFRNMTL